MSVIFIPPSSAASIADATETTAGKVRLATTAEATAGTNDVTAMTPAKVKAVVDAAVAGGVTYKGTFDAGSPDDLSNAVKGDLYIISGAGTYAGRSWAVGDHLLVNADMGGTFDSSKIDKIDSTDSVTSVAGRTGAVVLSAGDVSGLATVATSGAYADLSGTPTLATVATSGDYADLINAPTLSAVATSGAYADLSGTPTLATVATSGDYADLINAPTLSAVATSGAYADLSGAPTLATVATSGDYADLSGTPTLGTAAALNVGTSALNVVQLDASAKLPAVDGSLLTNLPSGASTLGALTDVTITSATNRQVLTYDSGSGDWINSAVAYADVTGTPTLATVATSGAYADLSGTPTLATVATSGDYADLINAPTLSAVATSGAYADLSGTPTLATVATSGDYADLSGTPTLGTAAALNVGTSALNVVQLDASAKLPAVDGSLLTNLPSGASTLGALTDVTITSATNGQVLTYDSGSGDWVNSNNASAFPTVTSYSSTSTLSALTENNLIRASNNITLTLPAASASTVGAAFIIKNVGVNTITIAAAGSDTIDGGASVVIDIPKNSLSIYCVSSSAWEIF